MTWKDSDHDSFDDAAHRLGRPGGDWQGMRPSFDNPMTWALPLGRVFRILVRVHIVFLIVIAVRLIQAAFGDDAAVNLLVMAQFMAALFLIVLLHEFGHCFACRYAGGTADEILMWPLGGLAFCMPPNHWRAHFITAAGGPMVNVLIWFLIGPTLGALTGKWLGIGVPDVLNPGNLFDPAINGINGVQPWWLLTLGIINYINMILLLFNAIPMFPMDGGRILQSLLWAKKGYTPSMRIALRVGYVCAIALCIFALVQEELMLFAIAIFGGLVCWQTHKQLQFTEQALGFEDSEYAAELFYSDQKDDDDEPHVSKRQQRRQEREAALQAAESRDLDRILDKIARTGIDSLSHAEQKLLKKATARKQKK